MTLISWFFFHENIASSVRKRNQARYFVKDRTLWNPWRSNMGIPIHILLIFTSFYLLHRYVLYWFSKGYKSSAPFPPLHFLHFLFTFPLRFPFSSLPPRHTSLASLTRLDRLARSPGRLAHSYAHTLVFYLLLIIYFLIDLIR